MVVGRFCWQRVGQGPLVVVVGELGSTSFVKITQILKVVKMLRNGRKLLEMMFGELLWGCLHDIRLCWGLFLVSA